MKYDIPTARFCREEFHAKPVDVEETVIAMSDATLQKRQKREGDPLSWIPTVCLMGLAVFYIALFGRYRAYEIDNPWYLSFSRSYWVDHFTGDRFLNGVFPDGMGGTAVFGRMAALLQGIALQPFEWRPEPALMFSVIFVLFGLALWYRFLRRSGWNVLSSSASIVALGLTEPFVGMANRFRYEPLTFVLFSAAFLLVAERRPTLAIIVGSLAVETQPGAAVVILSVLLFLARADKRPGKLLLPALLGAIVFTIYYFLLHPDIVSILQATNWHRGSAQREVGGFLRAYFLERKRHLPELLFFLGVFLLYFRRRRQAPELVRRMAEITGLICVFSFVMNWPTPAYMIFFFPPALVVAGELIESRWKRAWLLPAVMAILMVPQYSAVAYLNRGEAYRTQDIQAVNDLILRSEQRLGLEDTQTEVMGDYSLWFSHPSHYRALAKTTLEEIPREDLFLCFEGPIRPPAMVDQIVRYCDDVRTRTVVREIDQLMVRGHLLHVLAPARHSH